MPKTDSSAPRRLPVRRCIGPFYLASLFAASAFAGAAGVLCGIRINLFWVTLLGGALGGVIGVPLLCGLMDTVLRALRGTATGRWWPTYCAAWRQNWKDALPAGELSGALLGCWCWVIMTLPDMQRVPVSVWVCMAVGSCLLVGYFTYVYAQVVLVQLSLRSMLKNAGLLFLAAPLRTLERHAAAGGLLAGHAAGRVVCAAGAAGDRFLAAGVRCTCYSVPCFGQSVRPAGS